MAEQQTDRLLEMTVGIVANYVAGNRVEASSLAGLIQSVHASLAGVGDAVEEPETQPERLTSAQIRKLVTPAGIISLVNNKPFKSMKRHLSLNGFTPESYRAHFGLPDTFPMVHPDYAAARSALAKSMGLGQGGRRPKAAAPRRSRKVKT